ncbi:AAA family ATPase [Tundrisphaera lichenicola]|uniref:AAA family ATPase n=1 Tax=Tundrisphaera lichenicola TaxID=2029860 RepID=UPI003EBBB70B
MKPYMLTKIEISGFKSFDDFAVNLNPFSVIVGPNASGKSNLFDAIRLLSLLAGTDLRTAIQQIRGETHELFRFGTDGLPGSRMKFAVEVLLDPRMTDPWGAVVKITHSRIRYEVEIEQKKDNRGIDRLVVTREEASPILSKDDHWRPNGKKPAGEFKRKYLNYSRIVPWLTTQISGGVRRFEIRQDGHQGRSRPADAAEATVLSSITSADFPHLFGLREELRSWRFLQLDPVAMRQSSSTTAPDELEPNGSNLASVLARIKHDTSTPTRPQGVLSDIAIDLAGLIKGVVGLSLDEDIQDHKYRVDLQFRDAPSMSARIVSDGTLRVLALLTILHDPKHRGLICFEEPENGIHPGRLAGLIEFIRDAVNRPFEERGQDEEPLSQVLLNSHSPVFLSNLSKQEMMFADMIDVVDPGCKQVIRRTRIRPIKPENQAFIEFGDERDYVAPYEVTKYLSTVDRDA